MARGAGDRGGPRGGQKEAVGHCYWGRPLELGAAVLGTAWYPGAGLGLAEDEGYAEGMTRYPGALDAAFDVMRQCMKAVSTIVYGARWTREDPGPAAEAAQQASDAEKAWQRRHILSGGEP